jgi:hypothetical protein
MNILEKVNGSMKHLKWYDISLIKLSVLFATLCLVTLWPAFRVVVLSVAWYWYLVFTIIVALPVMKKVFF